MTEIPKDKTLPDSHLSFSTFVGQDPLKQDLGARIEAARRNSKPLPHILLCGPPEIGKVTLAFAIAREMGVNFQATSAPMIERPGELAAFLTNLDEGDLLILGGIESLSEMTLDVLIRVVEDSQIDITIGTGPTARNIQLDLKHFTLVCTTARPSQIDKRLRRWMIVYDFASYSREELGQIVGLLAKQQGLTIDIDAAELLADCCVESPGDARVIVKRLQDFVSTGAMDRVTVNVAREALASFGYLDKILNSVDLAEKLRKMDALKFEEFVADLFRKKGYAVEITQGSGDHGIDLLMRKDNQLIAVQCKRWNTPVGEPVVRDFLGSLIGIGAKFGYVIAATTFSSRAFSFVQDKPIKLIDLDALVDLVAQGSKDIDC